MKNETGAEKDIPEEYRWESLTKKSGIELKKHYKNLLSKLGETSVVDDLRTLAMSRLILDNVPHIKAYWVMYGKQTTEMALAFGADDIDGTIDDSTKIYSMAGADDKRPRMSVEDMRAMAANAGFRAVERDTFYNEL